MGGLPFSYFSVTIALGIGLAVVGVVTGALVMVIVGIVLAAVSGATYATQQHYLRRRR